MYLRMSTIGLTFMRTCCLVVILLAGFSGCNGEQSGGSGHGDGDGDALYPRLPKVTGHIDLVDANPENPRHFRTLRVTDGDGKRWEFQSEGWVGVSAGHLKDHQIQGAAPCGTKSRRAERGWRDSWRIRGSLPIRSRCGRAWVNGVATTFTLTLSHKPESTDGHGLRE